MRDRVCPCFAAKPTRAMDDGAAGAGQAAPSVLCSRFVPAPYGAQGAGMPKSGWRKLPVRGGGDPPPDLVQLTAGVMEQRGYAVANHGTWLEHRDSSIALRPHVVDFHDHSTGRVKSTSTMTVSHPDLIPDGIFEYQHAVGATLNEALCSGFDQWLRIDFVVLLDALRDQPETCSAVEFKWERGNRPDRKRRALLGPTGHMVEHGEPARDDIEHPFCPCCLQADCRINGEDFAAGRRALCDYVKIWPQAGVEMRKQYVVLQAMESPVD